MTGYVQMTDKTLRVCSYNIHKGFSSTNSRYLLDEIKHAVQLVNVDLLFLQEVVGAGTESCTHAILVGQG